MIREFFDKKAKDWDKVCRHNEDNIRTLLGIADINSRCTVLNIGCGTGILEKYILKYDPKKVVSIDFSEKMIDKAKAKYEGFDKIDFRCIDFFDLFDEKFDRILMYNVFPHFPDPEKVIDKCASLTNPGGKILICHGSSREVINRKHHTLSHEISIDLLPAGELEDIMKPYFNIYESIDNDDFYAVAATLRPEK